MAETRNLRILYTINANPQYILARTLRPVQVTLLPDVHAGPCKPDAKYATAPLKPCLDVVCRSSPELLQDKSRDFSVYHLDPLESSYVATQQGGGFDRGVAVGMGLLSSANDIADAPLMGTLVRLPTKQEALEIILSFHETKASRLPPSPIPPLALNVDTIARATPPPPPLPTPDSRNSATLQRTVSLPASTSSNGEASKAPPKWSLVNPSKVKKKPAKPKAPRADLIYAHTQTYIGPQVKMGRPRNRAANECTGGSFMRTAGPSSSSMSVASSYASTPSFLSNASLPPSSAPSSAPPSAPPTPNMSNDARHNLLDVMALIMACTGDPAQQAALLASLSTIDSSSPEQTAATLESVRALLLRGRIDSTVPPPAIPQNRSSDDDVILLDKENFNPSPTRSSGKDVPVSGGESERAAESSNHPGLHNSTSKSNATPVVVPPAAPAPSHNPVQSRKRTFDQFAAGTASRGSSSKEHRRQSIGENRAPATSPARPQRLPSSVSFPAAVPASSGRVVSASSPARPTARKPYRVPSWARTDTAMQPRLSDNAKRQLEDVAVQRRETRLARKRERRIGRQGLETEEESLSEGPEQGAEGLEQGAEGRDLKPLKPCTELPLFPLGTFHGPISSPSDVELPSTPPRRRAGSLPATPDVHGSSLFTPSTPRGLRAPTTPATPRRKRPSSSRTPRSKSVDADLAASYSESEEWDNVDDFLVKELSEPPEVSDVAEHSRQEEYDYIPPSSPLPPSSPPQSSPADQTMDLQETSEAILSPEPLVGTPNSVDGLSSGEGEQAFDMLQLFTDAAADFDPLLGAGISTTMEGSSEGIDLTVFENGLTDMDFTEFWQSMGPLLDNTDGTVLDGAAQAASGGWDGTGAVMSGEHGDTDVHALFSGCLL